jgi:hypothetical protein
MRIECRPVIFCLSVDCRPSARQFGGDRDAHFGRTRPPKLCHDAPSSRPDAAAQWEVTQERSKQIFSWQAAPRSCSTRSFLLSIRRERRSYSKRPPPWFGCTNAFAHCKVIGASEDGKPLLDAAGVVPDQGILISSGTACQSMRTRATNAQRARWLRSTSVRRNLFRRGAVPERYRSVSEEA